MRWEDRLLALFDDLEQQAEGLAMTDRDLEVAERSRAEYAAVDLLGRLHGSLGDPVVVTVLGMGRVRAELVRVGSDFVLLALEGTDWVVPIHALSGVVGLSPRAVAEEGRPVTARLGLGSVLRGLAEAGAPVLLLRAEGSAITGCVERVGADFVEMGAPHGTEVVPLAALVAIRREG